MVPRLPDFTEQEDRKGLGGHVYRLEQVSKLLPVAKSGPLPLFIDKVYGNTAILIHLYMILLENIDIDIIYLLL